MIRMVRFPLGHAIRGSRIRERATRFHIWHDNNSTWVQIHDQSTSANVTSSGTDFTITNPGSYQHYALVVTKNTGYHNVSLGEIKLGVTQSANLSEYYKLADWKTLIAGCADFAAFKTAVAAL